MISIIIPYWNAEKWIGRCVKSLLQPGDFQFILINDNSTDNGEQTAKECAGEDERFIFIENCYQKGVSGARNTGIDIADGEWISFLDADDELNQNAERNFELSIQNYAEANIIQTNHLRCRLDQKQAVPAYINKRGIYTLNHLPSCFYGVWNKIVKKEFLEKHQIRFVEGLQYGEDEIFVLDCLDHDNRLYHTPEHITTSIRHFDNRQSLSKVKITDQANLVAQSRAIEDFALRAITQEAKLAACNLLSEHWGSKLYLNTFKQTHMKYIIMCGGVYKIWETPKHLIKFNGEEIVARTIRLLREHGIEDISISTNNPVFEKFGLPILSHENSYNTRGYDDSDGYWCDAFYPTDVPTCYLFGDVIYSPDAIRTIINTETDDIAFFGSMAPFAKNYPKKYVEPFAFKVVNNEHLRAAIKKTKELAKLGVFNREPIAWELWRVIKGTPPNKHINNYVVINDYTCDIDSPEEVEKLRLIISKEL